MNEIKYLRKSGISLLTSPQVINLLQLKLNFPVFYLCLAACFFTLLTVDGEEPDLKPGARFKIEFPKLPITLAGNKPVMHVALPKNYDKDKTFPLLLWLNGSAGKPSINTSLTGKHDFIIVGMPLFKKRQPKKGDTSAAALCLNDSDYKKISSSFKKMLNKLVETVPNIDPKKRFVGGFSNGAHCIGILLNKRKFFSSFFYYYFLVEGGYTMKTSKVGRVMKGKSMLMLQGDKSAFMGLVKRFKKIRKRDIKIVVMKDTGHSLPKKYKEEVKVWITEKASSGNDLNLKKAF